MTWFSRTETTRAFAFLLSQQPLPTSLKVSNYNKAYVRARSRQRHAPLSPARRRLRPHGPHSSPRGRPHAGPGARAAALLAAGPRAMPPGGRPARSAAHGWVLARPGEPRRPCRRAGPGGSGETPAPRRSGNSGPRRAARAPRENLRGGRGLRSAPRTPAVRKRARKDPSALPGEATQSPPGAGPGLGRRLASRPRRGPSGQLPEWRHGRPPRRTNGRNGSADGRGLEAGAQGQGGPQGRLPRALGRQHLHRRLRRFRPRALRCHEPEGGGRSRESPGSGAPRPRRPGHVPFGRPMNPHGRGGVRAAAWPVTAGPRHVAGRTPMGGAGAT